MSLDHMTAEAIRENLVGWCVTPPNTLSPDWLDGFKYAIALLEDNNYHTGATALESWAEMGAK